MDDWNCKETWCLASVWTSPAAFCIQPHTLAHLWPVDFNISLPALLSALFISSWQWNLIHDIVHLRFHLKCQHLIYHCKSSQEDQPSKIMHLDNELLLGELPEHLSNNLAHTLQSLKSEFINQSATRNHLEIILRLCIGCRQILQLVPQIL